MQMAAVPPSSICRDRMKPKWSLSVIGANRQVHNRRAKLTAPACVPGLADPAAL
jgi:hypothetical protein